MIATILVIYLLGAFFAAAVAGLAEADAGEFAGYVILWPFVLFAVAAVYAVERMRWRT